MDAYDFSDSSDAISPRSKKTGARRPNARRRSKKGSGLIWNILTVLVLLMTVCVAGVAVVFFFNPPAALSGMQPPLMLATPTTPTIEPTKTSVLPPTWTPTPSPEPVTPTQRPSATPLFTTTPFEFATPTPEPGGSPIPNGFSFVLDQGSPKALPNIYHQERGCNWMGVGGMVVDLRGGAVQGIIVELGGSLAGSPITLLTITTPNTLASRLDFEFEISDRAIASSKTVWLQLLDQAGLPLSDKVYLDTYEDCDKNLIMVYFKQVR